MARRLPAPGTTKNAATVVSTQMRTIQTKSTGGTKAELVAAFSNWTKVKMLLETAGDVSIGTSEQIYPPISTKGLKLSNLVWTEFVLPPNSKLYICSTSVDTVKYIAEPIPEMS